MSTAGAISNVTISPEEPFVGDEVTITGHGDPDSEILARTNYTVAVPVENSSYEYGLDKVKVPAGTDNFSVEAENVSSLSIQVKKFEIPFTRTTLANSTGYARISQSHVPPMTYNITISGGSDEDEVNVTLEGASTIKADEEGYFEYSYKTDNIPAGLFIVAIDNSTFEIELQERPESEENETSPGLIQVFGNWLTRIQRG
ncbi:hypothetical protein Mpsy_0525 [Methanolobus psychrophilus R15]|nr:hypothetical protein Mpsy_0525 [Methanolobus psychrophilus R15]